MQNLAKRQENQQITLTAKPLHARVKKKKKTLSIRWGKPKSARCFIMAIPLLVKALALDMVGKPIHP